MRALTQLAQDLKTRTDISCVILTGGPNFCAGADLKDPELGRENMGALERRQSLLVGPDLCSAWEALEQITIAAIDGYCIGGGMALALACDWRVMGETSYFRLPEIPLGMNMSWQSNPRLVALVGPARAKTIVVLGEPCSADQAFAWGLADKLASDGTSWLAAKELAEKVVDLPPLAVRMSKQAINASAHALNYATSYMDRDQFAYAASSDDQREALTAFLEKRKPNFTGN
jgi:enoyl-CoA hydratase/carnithine racemase